MLACTVRRRAAIADGKNERLIWRAGWRRLLLSRVAVVQLSSVAVICTLLPIRASMIR